MEVKMFKKAAVLWTGGKDSSLALYKAKLMGFEIIKLVTFVPTQSKFLAHPLNFMKYQAEALDIQHYTIDVNEPYKESYQNAIHSLKREDGVITLITGDIAEINGYPNWIRECSRYSDVNVITPLWGYNRLEILNQLLSYKFKVIFSCVKKPWFTEDWLGMELDKNSLKQLCLINAKSRLDICGEQGEYHTLVVDGPPFKKSICIVAYSKCSEESLMYIAIQKVKFYKKLNCRYGEQKKDEKEARSWIAHNCN